MSESGANESGALTPTSKDISLTPSLTALFKPTFDLVGLEIRDYVKESIDSWKEKRRKRNLESHINAVNEQIKGDRPFSQNEPSINQLSLFEDWVEGVQDVDPADEELSAIWQSLLIRAAQGEHIGDEVRNALKSLSPKEAQFLLELKKRVPVFPLGSGIVKSRDRYLANQLLAKGLAEKDYAFPIFFITTMIASATIMFSIVGDSIGGLNIGVVAGGAAVFIAALGFSLRSGLARWRLSWLGQELIGLVKKSEQRVADRAQQGAPADR
ncbi:hypothetical protein [Marinobacter nauticus]|uniref:hypothetical protein n=1 Tax=Marinobacter nauticus TaxID=2743 RepID=UPI001C57C9F1|nr:hypothetical protein [Marinobacter nauticus]MBW3197612.1 hypothetical protein [Marinobacter nauticus]MBY6183022.1 hypothetical protein [Marinobacter nauticus]